MQQTFSNVLQQKQSGPLPLAAERNGHFILIPQELIGTMRVVGSVGLLVSSLSGLLQSQHVAKCLRADEAIQQSQATLLRTEFLRAPVLVRDEIARAGAETSVAKRKLRGGKKSGRQDDDSFGGILAACERM